MSDLELRLSQLHQIPVFALQDRFVEISLMDGNEAKLIELFHRILDKEPRKLDSAIRRLTRAQLTMLIDASPELFTDADIRALFEEYRYGTSPSFYLYQLTAVDPSRLEDLDQLKCRIKHQFDHVGADDETELSIGELNLNSLYSFPEQAGILEANYRYLQRLGYVDANQRAISTYQTLYGFFWINHVEGYAIVHGRTKQILKYVRTAIERALGICLVELVVSEQLQIELPFLDPEKIQLGIFRDPDPTSNNFSSVKVTNSSRHNKQFERLRAAYPEMPQANYADTAVGDKRTTISIYDKGLFKVFGRFTAAQIRNWCLASLRQVVTTLTRFHDKQADFIAALNLEQTDEFNRLGCNIQKDHLKHIVATTVAFKKMPGIGVYPLTGSPLQIAAIFGDLVTVQIPFPCQDVSCEEGHYFVCPICTNRHLRIVHGRDWIVHCTEHPIFPLNLHLPLKGECEKLQHYSLDSAEIESTIEIFLGRKLLGIIQDVINSSKIQDCSVDFDQEIIYISGRSYVYHQNRSKVFGRQGDTLVQNIYGGNYSNVRISDSPGTGVGTHAQGQHGGSQGDGLER